MKRTLLALYFFATTFLSVMFIGALVFRALPARALPTDPAASLDAPVLIGEVAAISPTWTKNGDGSFTLTATFVVSLLKPTVRVPVEVVVLGYPNAYGPATQMELNVKQFPDLLHHRVSVFGYFDKDGPYAGKYVADFVREL